MIGSSKIFKKGMFIIPGNPVKVHLLSVNALVELCANLLNIPIDSGQIYHIADKEPVYLVDLAKLFKKKIGSGGFYKLPAFLFNSAINSLKIFNEQRLKTSLQLIIFLMPFQI